MGNTNWKSFDKVVRRAVGKHQSYVSGRQSRGRMSALEEAYSEYRVEKQYPLALTEAGMKITFVQSENENLAFEYFSALLRARGHAVELAYDHRYFARTGVRLPKIARYFDERDMLVKRIVDGRPDLVAFSVMTSSYQWALDMARRIKRRCDTPIIFGGVHVSSVPAVAIKEEAVDMVCVGEGEESFMSLIDQFESYPAVEIPGIWTKVEGQVREQEPARLLMDLDTLPFPDKEIFYDELPWLSTGYLIMTSRGCPYSCTYCCNDTMRKIAKGKGQYVRRRSVDNVIEEMKEAKRHYNPKLFNIMDDCFTADKSWLREFCSRYHKEVDIPFISTSHPSVVGDEVASLLARAGCMAVLIGVQSTSEESRNKILNRKETNDQIRSAVEACHRHGLKLSIDHIFGIPGEGKEEYRNALRFYDELQPDVINTFWLVYFPRTTIVEHGLTAGILSPDDVGSINRGELDLAMNVGIGGQKRKKSSEFYNYAFLYSLIPLLPRRVMDLIVDKGAYLDEWSPPIALTLALRMISLMKLGEPRVYLERALEILIGFLKSALRIARDRIVDSAVSRRSY